MKLRILLFGLAMALALGVQAQKKDITKFMGIPIDGTKTAMIQKLKAKGFKYNAKLDRLEGEFNGRDSYISVVTNRNKVYRIVVLDANYSNEASIKIRFNSLVRQFMENGKYMPFDTEDQMIKDDVDISYEMSVHQKRFEASFYQSTIDDLDTTGMYKMAKQSYLDYLKEAKDTVYSEEEYIDGYYLGAMIRLRMEYMEKKLVWFMITELYGQYGIVLYYDNVYNQSNGEDL